MDRIDTNQMHDVIIQLKNNNMDAFDDFYELTKRQVYVSILSIVKNRMIADELMQDTYLRFLNNIHKYKEKTNVIAFIVTIARNLSINEYNRRKKETLCDFIDTKSSYIENTPTPLLDLVYEVLSGDELQVFIFHIVDGLKHREIAKIMKKPIGTITWLYNKALKKMKEKVGE